MTTQRLCSDRLLDISLLKNLMRRRLAHVLVAFLAGFFSLSVPIMMVFDGFAENLANTNMSIEYLIERAANDMLGITVINLLVSYAMAAYFGLVTLGYMMKRRSAHFYHALPQRRETLYVTSVASALLCAAAGAFANVVIASCEVAVFGIGYGEIVKVLADGIVNNMLVFITTYAITVFAGTLSGNRVVQTLMALVIMLYPMLTYLACLLVRASHASYFYETFYIKEGIMQWLSPFAHAVVNYGQGIQVLTAVLSSLAFALLLYAGLVIYKKRAIENSEKPIVFGKLGHVLKYMFMFTISAFSAMFFYLINQNPVFLIFGAISGGVLSFMLFNTILAKTPRAMFKGVKGLCIFLAVMLVYLFVFGFDVFDMDGYVPSGENIMYADISVGGYDLDDNRYDNDELLCALSELLKNQREANKKGIISPYSSSGTSFTVEAVMYTWPGIPVARRYHISKYTSGADEFLMHLANDARMQDAYEEKISTLLEHTGKNCTVEISYYLYQNQYASVPLDDILLTYISEAPKMNYDSLSKPSVGYIRFENIFSGNDTVYNWYDDENGRYTFRELPIYADMTSTLEMLGAYVDENTVQLESRDDFLASDSSVKYAVVYDIRVPKAVGEASDTRESTAYGSFPYPSRQITGDKAEELYSYAIYPNRAMADISRIFVAIDKEYTAEIYLTEMKPEDKEKYVDDYGKYYMDYEIIKDYSAYDAIIFPKGSVPQYVKDLFN